MEERDLLIILCRLQPGWALTLPDEEAWADARRPHLLY